MGSYEGEDPAEGGVAQGAAERLSDLLGRGQGRKTPKGSGTTYSAEVTFTDTEIRIRLEGEA